MDTRMELGSRRDSSGVLPEASTKFSIPELWILTAFLVNMLAQTIKQMSTHANSLLLRPAWQSLPANPEPVQVLHISRLPLQLATRLRISHSMLRWYRSIGRALIYHPHPRPQPHRRALPQPLLHPQTLHQQVLPGNQHHPAQLQWLQTLGYQQERKWGLVLELPWLSSH
jgi:hypothetical protein